MLPRRKFLSPSTTRRPKDQSDRLGSTEKIEKEGEVRLLLQRRRDQPTLGAVGKSSTVGQGDTTRSGWASCDSPAIFATSLHPGHHQGKLPGSGSGETCGSRYHHTSDSTEIPSGGHRLGCVLGNVKHVVTEGSQGFLEEKEGCWIRHHIQPRRLLFHPAGAPGGPNCHELREERVTIMNGMEKRDKWNIRGGQDEEWCGQPSSTRRGARSRMRRSRTSSSSLESLPVRAASLPSLRRKNGDPREGLLYLDSELEKFSH